MSSFLLRPLTALLAVIVLATSIPDATAAGKKKAPGRRSREGRSGKDVQVDRGKASRGVPDRPSTGRLTQGSARGAPPHTTGTFSSFSTLSTKLDLLCRMPGIL